MNQHKSKKVIIILIIILILLIGCSGLAYAYFATDFFKTDKQLFLKYATQVIDTEEGFLDSNLIQYFNKKDNTPYSNIGNFNVNIEGPDEEKIRYTNNMDITFSGKVDNPNSNLVQDISINYSNDIKLPFSLKKIGNTVGILQSNYVSKKYIISNINKLEDLNTSGSLISIQSATENVNKIGKISSAQISEEDIEHIKNDYLGFLIENLSDSAFGKVNENGKKGYKLNLNTNQLKDIAIKLLEKLKNDNNTLDKLNEYFEINKNSNKITPTSIENIITKLNNVSDNEEFVINIYPEDGRVSKIQFENKDINIGIEKIKSQDELQYKISMEILKEQQKEEAIFISVNYSGLSSLQNVKEDYKIGLDFEVDNIDEISQYSYNYNLENEVTFQETLKIEDFEKDNSFNLNDLNEEQKNNILTSIFQRLVAVNKKQMEKLGLTENENPLINIIPNFGMNKISNNNLEDETMREIEEAEIATFNAKLELYQGTNISGATVKGLLTVIANINELNEDEENYEEEKREDLIKEINLNGKEYQVNKQTLALMKEEIAIEDYFKVEFEKYEDTGKIYRVVINKK